MRSFISLILAFTMPLVGAVEELHFLEPHPLAGMMATDSVLVDMLGHYGKPPEDCESDEQAFQISGVPGMVCAPLCDASGGCPDDVPDGVTAKAQCALENRSTGDKFCVLICHEESKTTGDKLFAVNPTIPVLSLRGSDINLNPPVQDAQCGEGTCQIVQAGLGICTYS